MYRWGLLKWRVRCLAESSSGPVSINDTEAAVGLGHKRNETFYSVRTFERMLDTHFAIWPLAEQMAAITSQGGVIAT